MRHFKIPFLPIWVAFEDYRRSLASLELTVKAIVKKCGGRIDVTSKEIEDAVKDELEAEQFNNDGMMLTCCYPYAKPDNAEILWMPHLGYQPISGRLYPSTKEKTQLMQYDEQALIIMGWAWKLGKLPPAFSTSIVDAMRILEYVGCLPPRRRNVYWKEFSNMPAVMLGLSPASIADSFTVLHSRLPEAITRALIEASDKWKDSDERVRNFRERHSKIDRSQGRAGAKVELGQGEVPPWVRLEAMQPCEPEYIQTADGGGCTPESGAENTEHNQDWDNYRSIVYRPEPASSSRPPAEGMRHIAAADYNC